MTRSIGLWLWVCVGVRVYGSIVGQNHAARVITGATLINMLLSSLALSYPKERRNKQKALVMFEIMNGMAPI